MATRMRGNGAGVVLGPDGSPANRAARMRSTKVDRLRFARKAGLQYDDDRDIYQVAGYLDDSELTFEHFWSYYQRHDIAGRLVDMAPQTTWRNPPSVLDGEEDDTEFVEAFDEFAARDDIRLWHRLERTDRLSRIGSFGVLLIGQSGIDGDLATEMEPMNGQEDVIYLSTFHEGDVEIEEWETDPENRRFGQPTRYRIELSSGVKNFPDAEAKVHWSRVIHVAEDPLDNEAFGRSALLRVLNRLFDADKIPAATAEAFWQLADKILVATVDPEVQGWEDSSEDFMDAMEEIMHDLRRQIAVKGADLSFLGGDTPDPTGADKMLMRRIAAAASPPIPMRILFGTETGERASTQDEKQWLGSVSERIERHADPVILRALIGRLQQYGALPPASDRIVTQWPNLFEMDEKDEAEIDKTKAETAQALTPMGGDPIADGVAEITEEGRVRLLPKASEE